MVNAFTNQHTHTGVTATNGNANGVNGKDNGKADGAGKVLCTTELGLKCITKKAKTLSLDDGEITPVKGAVDPFERRILLAPKVMLDSAVDALTT